MEELPIFKKNAYLDVIVKDNCIFANLAYTDLKAQRTFVLSDETDLSPLKFRLDDIVFTRNFWSEYFNSLEKVFDWDIVDRVWKDIFKIKEFEDEGVGVSGIRVVVDDNQPFFKNIYLSVKEFSRDISLKMLDDKYMENLLVGFLDRLGYEDIVWLDLDISHFSIYRARKDVTKDFVSAKIDWSNEIGVIDFVKSSRLQAFLSVDSSSQELSDKWANFVAHNHRYVSDPVINDVLRAFTTLQLLSIKESHSEKINMFGRKKSALFLSGSIPKLLSKKGLFFSLIDGLELDGIVDVCVDQPNKVLSYGKSLLERETSKDIVVIKKDILPFASKLIIPEVPQKSRNKPIFNAKLLSQEFETQEIYGLSPNLQVINLPTEYDKVVVEGSLTNGAIFPHFTSNDIEFLSSKGDITFSDIVIDARERPIVYGPSVYKNRIKLKTWGDGDTK
jgi:hypothetical protein